MEFLKRYFIAMFTVALCSAMVLQVHAQEFGARDPAAVEAYEAGEELRRQEQWEKAIVKYDEATNIDNTYAEAWLGKGEALRELEDYETAFTAYRAAVEIDSKLARAYYGRAVCARELGQINIANSDFDNALQIDRDDPEILAAYGDLLINLLGDPNKAIRHLDKAIEIADGDAEVYRNRGWAHVALRQFDEAVADLSKAAELDGSDYETHARLASVHLLQEEFQPGIEALSRAIETYKPEEKTDPDTFVNGYLQRADALLRLGKMPETDEKSRQEFFNAALADTDAVLTEYPDRYPEAAFAKLRRGLAFRMQENYGQSIKAFTDAIQLAPGGEEASYLSEAYLKRGICWHYQKQNSLARGDFEQSATLNFEDPLPYLWIGFTYAQDGDHRQAIESYGEAIAKSPSFALAHVNRGLSYMQLGEFNKAVENFNEAIRSEPNKAQHFIKRGIAHMLLEEHQQAFDSFEHAIIRDEQNVEAHRRAAAALRKLGRPKLAEQFDNKAARLEAESK